MTSCPICSTTILPCCAATIAATLHQQPHQQSSNNASTEQQQGGSASVAQRLGSKPRVRTKHTYTPAFEEFWNTYPLHVGKFPAFKAWKHAINSGATEQQLLEGAASYSSNINRNPDKTKHAQGWLTDRRWEDDDKPIKPPVRMEPAFDLEKHLREQTV
jgi:hypothetical protein